MERMEEVKPKACPFCGSNNIHLVHEGDGVAYNCFDCHIVGPWVGIQGNEMDMFLEEEAMRLWNQRKRRKK